MTERDADRGCRLWQGLRSLVGLCRELSETGEISSVREVEVGNARAMVGITVREGLARGGPGRIRTSVKEAPCEVFDEGQHWRVVAEIPGADPGRVDAVVDHHRVAFNAAGPGQAYRGNCQLPGPVRTFSHRCVNGVLELWLEKEDDG